jgi:ketosteroid isomerase-like protein
MSANLDLVRSIFSAWERGDYRSFEWADPGIEIVIVDGPHPGTWRGPAGMAESFREWGSAWEDLRVKVDEYRVLDDERVAVVVHRRGRGKISGLDLEQMRTHGVSLFHVRGGRVTRLITYFDRERAFADLGLKE